MRLDGAAHVPRSRAQNLPQPTARQPCEVGIERLQEWHWIGASVQSGPQRHDIRSDGHRRPIAIQPSSVPLQRVV
jgi:hypothetical protein